MATDKRTSGLDKFLEEPIPVVEWFTNTKYYQELLNGTWGSFAQAMCTAWYHADRPNRIKLVTAFPDIFPTNPLIKYY